ncbi:ribosome maturation factor RimM [[Clostridium] colinum]|uniref:ribosome maturation factor RimM n=1 Tax=[Clostridium] colinum TaxID=36835 RepID=UPI002023F24B|nr:ribosome maturation factor RimM [[Clostridium] colinum]
MSDYFVIGKIVNTQGIKGEVRVLPTTDDINRFKKLKEVYISKRNNMDLYEIETVRFHKQFVLLTFKGINSMNDAELLKNTEIKIPKDLALPCEKDEYYISDLYGMKVFTDLGEDIGIIDDIIFTGANDVYVVKKEDSQILIPAIKQCILNVDIKEKTMKVHLLEGLR